VILFLRAAVAIAVSAIGVRALGFHKTKLRIESLSPARPRTADACVLAIRRARSYGACRGNCLSQSLALLWLLRRAGHDAAIHIGVKPSPGGILAHAWVELHGETLDPSATSAEYAALASHRQ
jgi:hypothetical protein